jgi:hypothetical protein
MVPALPLASAVEPHSTDHRRIPPHNPVPRAGFEPAAYSLGGIGREGTGGHAVTRRGRNGLHYRGLASSAPVRASPPAPRLTYPSRTSRAWTRGASRPPRDASPSASSARAPRSGVRRPRSSGASRAVAGGTSARSLALDSTETVFVAGDRRHPPLGRRRCAVEFCDELLDSGAMSSRVALASSTRRPLGS